MKNLKEREDIIKFALMLNSTNLSPLRSGNLSIRVVENDVEGFLLTPSGIKYETLKPEDIVFLALSEEYDNLKMFNYIRLEVISVVAVRLRPARGYITVLECNIYMNN